MVNSFDPAKAMRSFHIDLAAPAEEGSHSGSASGTSFWWKRERKNG